MPEESQWVRFKLNIVDGIYGEGIGYAAPPYCARFKVELTDSLGGIHGFSKEPAFYFSRGSIVEVPPPMSRYTGRGAEGGRVELRSRQGLAFIKRLLAPARSPSDMRRPARSSAPWKVGSGHLALLPSNASRLTLQGCSSYLHDPSMIDAYGS